MYKLRSGRAPRKLPLRPAPTTPSSQSKIRVFSDPTLGKS